MIARWLPFFPSFVRRHQTFLFYLRPHLVSSQFLSKKFVSIRQFHFKMNCITILPTSLVSLVPTICHKDLLYTFICIYKVLWNSYEVTWTACSHYHDRLEGISKLLEVISRSLREALQEALLGSASLTRTQIGFHSCIRFPWKRKPVNLLLPRPLDCPCPS